MSDLRQRLAEAAHAVDCGCDDEHAIADLLVDDAYREHADRALSVFAGWLRERAETWADDPSQTDPWFVHRVPADAADEIAPRP